jgi:hypothetical protein
VVREYSGHDQLEGHAEETLLAAVYKPMVPLLNFFMPSQKLSSKTWAGSKEIVETLFSKVYGEPKSPFQIFIENAALPRNYKDMLNARHLLYNPVEL